MDTNAPDVVSFYRLQSRIYDLSRWVTLHGRTTAIREARLMPGDSVLDLGCGTGLSFQGVLERIGTSGHVTGVDLSPHMLQRARARIAREGWRNVTLLQADMAGLALGRHYDLCWLLIASAQDHSGILAPANSWSPRTCCSGSSSLLLRGRRTLAWCCLALRVSARGGRRSGW